MSLPHFTLPTKPVFIVAGTLTLALTIGLALVWFSDPSHQPETKLASCTTPAGTLLNHQQIKFGTCGTDICESAIDRPIYSCNNGAVLSTCIPDSTCHDFPDYDNRLGRIAISAGNTCPEEALFGCNCSSGPDADDSLSVGPTFRCPYRYCFSLSQATRSCIQETYYYSDTCPTNLLMFPDQQSCQDFNSTLTDADFKALADAASRGRFKQRQTSGGGTGAVGLAGGTGTANTGIGGGATPLPSTPNLAGTYTTSPLSKLYYQIVGLVPTKYLPPAIANIVESGQEEPLLFGVDPNNPNYITITSPASGDSLTGSVNITGGATNPDFTYYYLEYAPDPNPQGAWTPITGQQTAPVFDGILGTWNTTTLANGTYQLRLAVSLEKTHFHFRYVTINNLHITN